MSHAARREALEDRVLLMARLFDRIGQDYVPLPGEDDPESFAHQLVRWVWPEGRMTTIAGPAREVQCRPCSSIITPSYPAS